MNKQKYISEYCTGCGLCESMKKAEMFEDEKGFPRVRRDSISDVRELEKLCPVFGIQSLFPDHVISGEMLMQPM